MTYAKIDKLLEAISDVVGWRYSWQTKHKAIMDHATPEEITCLLEFVSWFESPFESPEMSKSDAPAAGDEDDNSTRVQPNV